MCANASLKTFWRAVARGPGAWGCGGAGEGEGERGRGGLVVVVDGGVVIVVVGGCGSVSVC